MSQTPAHSNILRSKLQSGVPGCGVVLSIASPVTAQLAARLGFDWALIDIDGFPPHNASVVAEMVAAVTATQRCSAILRLPVGASEEVVRLAVDVGAHGVIVTGVHSGEQLWGVVRVAKAGRSSPPMSRPDEGDVLVIPQIESTEAVDRIHEILAVPGVDAAFVRPQNLPSGHASPMPVEPIQRVPGSIPVGGALGRIVRAAGQLNVPLGIDCADGDTARMRIQQGFGMVVVANDADLLSAGATEQLRRAQSS
ncbi:Phosphoenolpyruvate/pyruvate domain-containing protein [Linderina pennispora]|uniref:Phosphoenolpyruvate/pyruvate domain-containing protein n=1 Tax=Linderina pennispora TaxID=61395 RepID=A0A1Y1W4L4_9FUNG|nr:Phosphoenolpyruvate/pyruvate domain-containing protein [Linderina pennispora]ORX68489.1 Phosphoenolpyruvate/pyruvate domain-containing protein [Linderina pennispora]